MTLTVNRIFLVISCICFAIALLLLLGAFNGSSAQDWEVGGLLALALGLAL